MSHIGHRKKKTCKISGNHFQELAFCFFEKFPGKAMLVQVRTAPQLLPPVCKHRADLRVFKTFQVKIYDGVQYFQIYCPSSCDLHCAADIPLGLYWKLRTALSKKSSGRLLPSRHRFLNFWCFWNFCITINYVINVMLIISVVNNFLYSEKNTKDI